MIILAIIEIVYLVKYVYIFTRKRFISNVKVKTEHTNKANATRVAM